MNLSLEPKRVKMRTDFSPKKTPVIGGILITNNLCLIKSFIHFFFEEIICL